MLIMISPAKTLDYDSPLPPHEATQPRLLDHSDVLVQKARTLTAADLKQLMKVSDKIAQLNVERFTRWSTPFTSDNARPALFAFKVAVYPAWVSVGSGAATLMPARRACASSGAL